MTSFSKEDLAKMGLQDNGDGSFSKPQRKKVAVDITDLEFTSGLVKLKKGKVSHKDTQEIIAKDNLLYFDPSDEISLVLRWADKDISLNAWYSSKHWTHRNKQKNEWHSFFKSMLHEPYPHFETYTITLRCNSRLDPSNCITMIKLLEDMLQEIGVIGNDSARFCKGVHIIPDMTMKRKSYEITVV